MKWYPATHRANMLLIVLALACYFFATAVESGVIW